MMERLELVSEHRGLRYGIVYRDFGLFGPYRCGYVEVPSGHPDELAPDAPNDYSESAGTVMYGGTTYRGHGIPLGEEDDPITFVGFDTAHFCDDDETRSLEFVEAECLRVVNLLADWRDGQADIRPATEEGA